MSDYKGKVVVLNFWGSWCGPCIQKLPVLNSIAEEYPDDVVVLGVMEDTVKNAKACLAKHGVEWPNIVDNRDHPIHSQWNIDSWPTTYFIGRDGKIAAKNRSSDQFLKTVRELVKEQDK